MRAPAVSVLIPCFNHGHWIDEAVDSVLQQTMQDFEIIVVDDGSSDVPTIEKLAAYDRPRTRIVRTDNRGLPAARNHAASLATGRFYCALDADDRLAPRWLESALGALQDDPGLAFVSHWLEAFGDEQWSWQPVRCDLSSLLARNVVNSAALIRREAFEAVGGFDETMQAGCEDWDFWLRVVEAGFRGRIVPEVHYFYRRSAGSMSRHMTRSAESYRVPLEQLVQKHVQALRDHALDVLVSKEAEGFELAREIHRLERDYVTEIRPALAGARQGAVAAQELAAAESMRRDDLTQLEDQRAQLEADVTRLREENGRLRDELSSGSRELMSVQSSIVALQAHAAERNREIESLRNSWSWRLTHPMRALVALLRGEP
ncbi:MAG TPA: glycosyltransferase [Vicinamibacterales bacterium]|jgi:Glycosyl transferase family 2|nr:glycosyltransferase [Vicinamibacterales bacterium]